MATILDMHGDTLTDGLQGCDASDEAIRAAERIADRRGEDVELVDDDGRWLVHPARDGEREPADLIG